MPLQTWVQIFQKDPSPLLYGTPRCHELHFWRCSWDLKNPPWWFWAKWLVHHHFFWFLIWAWEDNHKRIRRWNSPDHGLQKAQLLPICDWQCQSQSWRRMQWLRSWPCAYWRVTLLIHHRVMLRQRAKRCWLWDLVLILLWGQWVNITPPQRNKQPIIDSLRFYSLQWDLIESLCTRWAG